MPQKLGQHFLKNISAIKKIIAVLDIQSGETIIEVGPGKGALTLPMAENLQFTIYNLQIIAIEKDGELIRQLNKKIKDLELKNIKVIEGDVLKILPELVSKLKIVNYKLVGNIPYYITGKLLRTISELKNKPAVSVLMAQKEVAERICAVPPQMNLLAAATQYWASPEIILKLKAKEFDPPPEVDSAVIKLTTKKEINDLRGPKIACDFGDLGGQKVAGFKNDYPLPSLRALPKQSEFNETKNYYKLVHIIFKQPRKTLANNLKDGLEISREEIEKILNTLGLPLNSRPQDISVDNILKLAQRLKL